MMHLYDMPLLTANQMRLADDLAIQQGLAGEQLMQRAGAAIADAIVRCGPDAGRVVMVIGGGNNGGDALAAATILRKKNAPVTVIPLFPLSQFHGDAAIHLKRAQQAGVKIRPVVHRDQCALLEHWLKRAILVVDAIFGTGLSRPVEGWVAQAIACINQGDRSVLSVDIASGLHSDSGQVLGIAIRATHTLPIAAYKWGHVLNQGVDHSGCLLSPANIGITQSTLHQVMKSLPQDSSQAFLAGQEICHSMLKASRRLKQGAAHKGDFGHVWVVGGSKGYTGAPKLAAQAAFAAGAGLVSILCPDDVYSVIATSSLEVMVHQQRDMPPLDDVADAMVIGSGWGRQQKILLVTLLALKIPLVLDADALNILAANEDVQQKLRVRREKGWVTILTPHPGEAARLLGCSSADVQAKRKESLLALTKKFQCHVVLKGQNSLFSTPELTIFLSRFGSSRLAVAGSGDVLAGMIAARLAMLTGHTDAVKTQQAVLAALVWHGMAGERQDWYLAGQLINNIASMRNDF